MKTSRDPRHINRVKVMQQLFSWDFKKELDKQNPQTSQIIGNLPQIDKLIQTAATSWSIEKINKIDLAILRLAVFELTLNQATPVKVVVDEAVEIAKEYGGDSSPAFVNGALGKLINDLNLSTT